MKIERRALKTSESRVCATSLCEGRILGLKVVFSGSSLYFPSVKSEKSTFITYTCHALRLRVRTNGETETRVWERFYVAISRNRGFLKPARCKPEDLSSPDHLIKLPH